MNSKKKGKKEKRKERKKNHIQVNLKIIKIHIKKNNCFYQATPSHIRFTTPTPHPHSPPKKKEEEKKMKSRNSANKRQF